MINILENLCIQAIAYFSAKEKVCLPAGLAAGDEYKMQREIV